MGDSDIFQPEDRKNHTFQFTDSLVWVKGRHTLQFGGDLRRLRLFYLVEDFGQGVFQFDDGASSVSGSAFSDFLLGRPFLSYAQAGNSGGNDRLDYLGAYFTDEFHVTPRFSLTYGLREEFYTPPVNVDGRASILDPADAERFIVLNDHGQAAALTASPLIQQLSSLYGLQFITSQQAGLPNSLIKPDWSNWAPRLGFAYDLTGDGKNALRGGLGVFNSLMELDYTAETRLSAPLTEFLLGLDLCRFYGPGACGQSYAPPVLTYQLGYTLGQSGTHGHLFATRTFATVTFMNGAFPTSTALGAQYRSLLELHRVRWAQTSAARSSEPGRPELARRTAGLSSATRFQSVHS